MILTYSPYNTLAEYTTPNLANDGLGETYVPRGYARAVADVLGTRNSSGCWDYGGADEQQSGVDLVNFLASQPWSNGKVAMIGGSYDGTTANMVAARGADAPGLVGDRARGRDLALVRLRVRRRRPLLPELGGRRPTRASTRRSPSTSASRARRRRTRATRCSPRSSRAGRTPASRPSTPLKGYDRTPDYDDFWLERDYLKDADNFRAAVLLAHGWQDYNVKQDEGVRLFEALGDERAVQARLPLPGHPRDARAARPGTRCSTRSSSARSRASRTASRRGRR